MPSFHPIPLSHAATPTTPPTTEEKKKEGTTGAHRCTAVFILYDCIPSLKSHRCPTSHLLPPPLLHIRAPRSGHFVLPLFSSLGFSLKVQKETCYSVSISQCTVRITNSLESLPSHILGSVCTREKTAHCKKKKSNYKSI